MMLTHNQRKLLTYLNHYVQENEGVSPSFDEMCKAMGLRSKSGIHKILDGLEDRGFISRVKGLPRAIEVLRCPDGDATLIARIKKLEEALQWYADPVLPYAITQANEPRSAVHRDKGAIARAALSEGGVS